MQYFLIALYVALTSTGLIVLKLGSSANAIIEIIDGRLSFNINWLNVIGVILYALSFVLYLYIIAKNDLGYIVPLTTAIVYIIIFVASFVIFKETFTAIKIAGICLIAIGVILLNIKNK